MAISRLYNFADGSVPTAAQINGELNNIINNARDLISPLTSSLDMDGYELILDADADTSVIASTDDQIDWKIGGVSRMISFTAASSLPRLHLRGAVADYNNSIVDVNGNEILDLQGVASAINQLGIVNAAASGEPAIVARGGDTDINITLTPKGAGTIDLNGNLSGTGIATQAQQETGSAVNVAVTPGRQQYHPSAAKMWVFFNSSATILASYNVTSITDTGTGDWTVNITTAFSTNNYCAVGNTNDVAVLRMANTSGSALQVRAYDKDGILADVSSFVAAFGDQ